MRLIPAQVSEIYLMNQVIPTLGSGMSPDKNRETHLEVVHQRGCMAGLEGSHKWDVGLIDPNGYYTSLHS